MREPDFRVKATEYLKTVRVTRRFSQNEIAGAATGLTGIPLSEASYNKVEQQERTLSLLHGQAIAKILGVGTTEVFSFDEQESRVYQQ